MEEPTENRGVRAAAIVAVTVVSLMVFASLGGIDRTQSDIALAQYEYGGGGGSGGGSVSAADLRLTGSAEPVSVPVRGTLTWRLRVSDLTSGSATGVYVDAELPTGVALVLAQTDRGSGCVATGARKLRCNLDWLSSSVPFGNVTLVTAVTATGELVLTATTGFSAADPNPADNTLVLKANTSTVPTPPPAVVKPKPVFGKPLALPARPVAGQRFTFTLAVKRSDTGTPLRAGRMLADPSVAGKPIKHVESFKAGKARLSFVVPKTAKGKQLKIKIKIITPGQTTTRVFTYKVR